tara:strand:+ start:912 stop:1760 length:849 start_codon:yes stop_codon:yes gene_type:complete
MKINNKKFKSQVNSLSKKDLKRLETLLKMMSLLRDKTEGCPWDLIQNFETIASHTVEEAYEVLDAITDKNYESLKNELGDLLLQVIFHSQMAKELNLFDMSDVIFSINKKLINRHPHIFKNNKKISEEDVLIQWEKIKNSEKKLSNSHSNSSMDGITKHLPTLIKAQKIQQKANFDGFDWENVDHSLDNLLEEIKELKIAIKDNKIENIKDECGDLLFSSINVIRKLNFNADTILNEANKKFIKRYKLAEKLAIYDGKEFSKLNLVNKHYYWKQSKKELKDN